MKLFEESYLCTICGRIRHIQRREGHKRCAGHKKHMLCVICDKITEFKKEG